MLEEGFSRGLLFKNVAEGLTFTGQSERWRAWAAYGLSAVLFGLQHAGNAGVTPLEVLNLMGLGLLFGAARLWTGDLSFGIGMHAAWNIASANVFGTAADGGAEGGAREVSRLLLRTEHAPLVWRPLRSGRQRGGRAPNRDLSTYRPRR